MMLRKDVQHCFCVQGIGGFWKMNTLTCCFCGMEIMDKHAMVNVSVPPHGPRRVDKVYAVCPQRIAKYEAEDV